MNESRSYNHLPSSRQLDLLSDEMRALEEKAEPIAAEVKAIERQLEEKQEQLWEIEFDLDQLREWRNQMVRTRDDEQEAETARRRQPQNNDVEQEQIQ